jgi:WD40 repeat protein
MNRAFLHFLILAFAVVPAAGCASAPPPVRPVPRAVLEAHAREIHALAFSPDGTLFASAGPGTTAGSDEITLWTTAAGERRMTFANYKGIASCLAFSPDGKLLAVGATEGRIALLEIESGAERISFMGRADRPGRVSCLAFSFDGKALVSVVRFEGDKEDVEVIRWDVTRGAPRETVATNAVPPLALSPDGGSLAWPVPGLPSGIAILDLETKVERLLSKVAVHGGDNLIFSPDGKWLAAVHHEDWSPLPNRCPYVYLIDAQTGRIRLRSPRPFDAKRGLAVSHDGKLLVRGVDDGLQIWDLGTLEVRATVSESPQKTEGAEMLVFSPDDQTLVSTDGRGLLLLWDVPRLLEARHEAASSPHSR